MIFDQLLKAFNKQGVNIVGFSHDACLLVTDDSGADDRVISAEKTVAMIIESLEVYTYTQVYTSRS